MPLAALREILEAADFRSTAVPEIRGADRSAQARCRQGCGAGDPAHASPAASRYARS